MKPIANIMSMFRRGLDMATFRTSEKYWIERYRNGGNSGYGSYGELAQYKADILNNFVVSSSINTVIEYGCGDGNQLALAKYPHYVGFDISPDAIALCKKMFDIDPTKSFYLMSEYTGQSADLTLSLDVIYHLVEDDVFESYMRLLFHSSNKYVIVYSSNMNARLLSSAHVKHRQFTSWVNANLPDWDLIDYIPNANKNSHKSKKDTDADFFIYQKNIATKIVT